MDMDKEELHYYVDKNRFAFHLEGRHYIMEDGELHIDDVRYEEDGSEETYELTRQVARLMHTERLNSR